MNCCEGLSVGNLACWAWERRRRMCFCTREASRSFTALGVAFEMSTGCSPSHCCCEGRHILREHDWVDPGRVKTSFSVKEHPKECGFRLV